MGFLDFGPEDIIDILLVSLLLYQAYKLVAGSMAVKVFIGFILIYASYFLVEVMGMELSAAILNQFREVGVLAAIILFQQEIRKFLFLLGGKTTSGGNELLSRLPWGRKGRKASTETTPIVDAAKALAGSNTGAIMVLSNEDDLKFYEDSGDFIDAIVSKRLLIAIFNAKSPLHDGGIIIRHGKIVAARCILPVTERQDLPPQWGLRHRAAIGMSEVSDTLTLIVSEETGQISIARKGTLFANLSTQEIRAKLYEYLQNKHES
ncbi:MAG: diadenylate cyclase CdaA [Bacteroidota bacterium]